MRPSVSAADRLEDHALVAFLRSFARLPAEEFKESGRASALTAKRRGLWPEVMPVLERMTRLGMFASAALVAEVRRLAGKENR